MDSEQAWLYAAEWGSYMRSGDPGACMYGFDERFTVQSEEHRKRCLAWIDDECIPVVKDNPDDYDADELDKLAELRRIIVEAKVNRNG